MCGMKDINRADCGTGSFPSTMKSGSPGGMSMAPAIALTRTSCFGGVLENFSPRALWSRVALPLGV